MYYILDTTVQYECIVQLHVQIYMYKECVIWITILLWLTQVEPRVGCKDETQQEHPTREEKNYYMYINDINIYIHVLCIQLILYMYTVLTLS